MARRGQKDAIRWFILATVASNPQDIAKRVVQQFGVTRQTANYHLQELVKQGMLRRKGGPTRQAEYVLEAVAARRTYPIEAGLAEDEVWRQFAEPLLRGLPRNISDICFYGFTEMVNNVIDHSEGTRVILEVSRSPSLVTISVTDAGIGIFTKIRRTFGLESNREALFELSKGKLTTDPSRHTGEGIFFTSRMFDRFSILSGELFLTHSRGEVDWLLESSNSPSMQGTRVHMAIAPSSTCTSEEVFNMYATPQEDFGFNRTTVVIKLAEHIEGPMLSRSQAKRVLARLDRFKEVVLNFEGIETIGPAFADEVFRVFARNHPGVTLLPVEMTSAVERMVNRARRASDGTASD